jgi:outer membrane protein
MRIFGLVAGAFLAGVAALSTASAQTDAGNPGGDDVAGHIQLRLRGLGVLPDASGSVSVAGVQLPGSLSITNSFVPEIDGTYFLTHNIGFELIAATTQHSVHQSTAGDIGSVWLLPPTLTAQYHLDPDGSFFRPYVGAGINYTFFYSVRSPVPALHYANNVGWALQAGSDFPLNGPWFLNVDVKKVFLSTDATGAGGLVQGHADINPWLIGGGVGIRL